MHSSIAGPGTPSLSPMTIAFLPSSKLICVSSSLTYFYTNLTLDSRFVNVGDNKWDLRERLPFEKVHIDMNDIYNDDEEGYEELTSSDSEDEEMLMKIMMIMILKKMMKMKISIQKHTDFLLIQMMMKIN